MSDELKKMVARAAVEYVQEDTIIGVGTGSTVRFFIEALAEKKHLIEGAVASSEATAVLLKAHQIPVYELNTVDSVSVYIDSADECSHLLQMIKGGGGALTREKILAAVAKQFICIIDESKLVRRLGAFSLPIEVIPMARSYVAREIVKLGGDPSYRDGVKTDNGNIILDVAGLNLDQPIAMESTLNNIVGVVSVGLFAAHPADRALVACSNGKIETIIVGEK